SDRLPEPIFTPASKASSGHDENISFDAMTAAVGADRAERMRAISCALYAAGSAHAEARGLVIADTKFEFGLVDDEDAGSLILIDECLTPDSSRFWPAASYQPGRPTPSWDKQIVRDWLHASGWGRAPPAP